MNNARFYKVKGTGKNSGKPFTAYQFEFHGYKTGLLFPTPFEKEYLDKLLLEDSHKDFKGDDLDIDEDGRF